METFETSIKLVGKWAYNAKKQLFNNSSVIMGVLLYVWVFPMSHHFRSRSVLKQMLRLDMVLTSRRGDV